MPSKKQPAAKLPSIPKELIDQFVSGPMSSEAVMGEVTAWQSRPLEPMYPVVFFDALRVKIREDAVVRNKAVYLALGVLPDGTRDILGLWIENTEGARFWMKVFNDLKTRGHFPTDEAATKLIWLALRNITAEWKSAITYWKAAMNQFAILYGERFIPAVTR